MTDWHGVFDRTEAPAARQEDDGPRRRRVQREEKVAGPAPEALGKCSFCERPGTHKWPRLVGGKPVLFCHEEHWNKRLAAVATDMTQHPELYRESDTNDRRARPARPDQRKRSGYGAKGDANWSKRAGL